MRWMRTPRSATSWPCTDRDGRWNASKGFVHNLTRFIAVDRGPKVRCDAVSPGWIMTGMAESGFALANDPEKASAASIARRFGKPEVSRMSPG